MLWVMTAVAGTVGTEWEVDWVAARIDRHAVDDNCDGPNDESRSADVRLMLQWQQQLFWRDRAAWLSSDEIGEGIASEGLMGWLTGDFDGPRLPIHWIREVDGQPKSVFYAEYVMQHRWELTNCTTISGNLAPEGAGIYAVDAELDFPDSACEQHWPVSRRNSVRSRV